jgi:UDP-N-acetylmuramoyl-L-alanyl-D-glutamate--2,6-diaminopimelate ligase
MKKAIKKITPSFLLSFYHFLLLFLGALFYGFPGRKIKIIGVTGTKGKSTTVELISAVLEEAGFKTALATTVRFKIREKSWKNMLKMTMPGRWKLQKFLKQAVEEKCDFAVLEVTSEGILQHRHRFIKFNTVVFTNLSPEHIERHGSFENYRAAKGKLFKACKNTHVVNLDDENAEYFLRFPSAKKYLYTAGKKSSSSPVLGEKASWEFVKASDIKASEKGIEFKVRETLFSLGLLGRFNVYNALCAVCVGLSEGIDLETCKRALGKFKGVPGRMEVVLKEPFRAIVDYAHTPDSLEQVYKECRELKSSNSNLICVLGSCGGGRDKWKRPKLGEAAGEYCDYIILTNEDPYDEEPSQILSQIKSGIPNSQLLPGKLYEILDRREAIRKALSLAKEGDIVVITGKGSEPWMCVEGGKKIPWDDRKIVREEFNQLK